MTVNTNNAEAAPGTPQELRQELSRYRNDAHILSIMGQTTIDRFPIGLQPSIRFVHIDLNTKVGQVYEPFEKKGWLRLTAAGLDKLAQVAGVQFVKSERTDDRTDPHFCEYQVEVKLLDIDGSWRTVIASRAVNLRDGSPEVVRMSDKELARARQNICALAESKARNRCYRPILGIQAEYTPQDLEKPFVVVRMVPDTSDPEVKRMLLASQLGLEKYLFAALPTTTVPEQAQLPEARRVPALAAPTADLPVYDIPADNYSAPYDNYAPVELTAVPHPPPVPDTAGTVTVATMSSGERADRIQTIINLYKTKIRDGRRDPGKPPLESLADSELLTMIEYMTALPDVPKVRV